MRAERQLVTLRHPEKDITLPEMTLRACSPVLDGILRDASPPDDGGNKVLTWQKVLTIDDVCLDNLRIFVDMITANSYAPTNMSDLATYSAAGFRSEFLAYHTDFFMPLIHKYDCQGLLIQLQESVNATCSGLTDEDFFDGLAESDFFDGVGKSIASMRRYDTEDASQWMTASTLHWLAAYLSVDHNKDDYAHLCRAKLDGLPSDILDELRALESVAPRRKYPLIRKGGTELRGAKRGKRA